MTSNNPELPELPQRPHTPWWKVLATLTPFLGLVWAVTSKFAGVV